MDWKFKFVLKSDHVYNGFIILSLLEDHHTRQTTLVVPHTGDHEDRFKAAMTARNDRMRLYGQPEILHICSKCVRFYTGADGSSVLHIYPCRLPF